jgi:hypothetical protein
VRILVFIIVSLLVQKTVAQELSETDYKAINCYLNSWHNIMLDLKYHRDSENLKLEYHLKDCDLPSDNMVSRFSLDVARVDSTSQFVITKLNTSTHSALYCLFDLEKRLPFSIVSKEQMNNIFKQWSNDLSNFEKSIIYILLSREFKQSRIAMPLQDLRQSQLLNNYFYQVNFYFNSVKGGTGGKSISAMKRNQTFQIQRNSKNEKVNITFNKAGDIIQVKY